MSEMSERSSQVSQGLHARDDAAVLRVAALLAERPERRWSVGEMALRASMGRVLFASRFRAATGLAPGEFLKRCRLERAALMLAHLDESVAEVGVRCGWDSDASFSRAFKREYGLTPGAFRKAARVIGIERAARGAGNSIDDGGTRRP